MVSVSRANGDGSQVKVPQIGGVVIGDDVEIGACSTIDRGAIGDTVIADGVKLDNQIQVGHNIRIGAHTVIAGQTGISGSTSIGARCTIGGAVAIAGHLIIADDVVIGGGTSVPGSILSARRLCRWWHTSRYSAALAQEHGAIWPA